MLPRLLVLKFLPVNGFLEFKQLMNRRRFIKSAGFLALMAWLEACRLTDLANEPMARLSTSIPTNTATSLPTFTPTVTNTPLPTIAPDRPYTTYIGYLPDAGSKWEVILCQAGVLNWEPIKWRENKRGQKFILLRNFDISSNAFRQKIPANFVWVVLRESQL